MNRHHPRNSPTRPLALIVEGHDDTGAMHALALSATGFDVVTVHDSADVCRRALEIHPDLIVVDLPMPDHDAWQLLDTLKRNPRTRDIPVVAMNGLEKFYNPRRG
jgi:CheY-like chemotaxis protein